jgi:hypothetical protein
VATPTSAIAAMAAGSPRPRPVGGWTGPAATATGDGVDVGVGAGGTTVGVTPGRVSVRPALGSGPTGGGRSVGGRVAFGVGATRGPLPERVTLGLGEGAGDDDDALGELDGEGEAPTVIVPWAVPAPFAAVTSCVPEAVAW